MIQQNHRAVIQVSRYDETYRDCGLLDQMGGLGAHSDTDYVTWPSGMLVTDFLRGKTNETCTFEDYKQHSTFDLEILEVSPESGVAKDFTCPSWG